MNNTYCDREVIPVQFPMPPLAVKDTHLYHAMREEECFTWMLRTCTPPVKTCLFCAQRAIAHYCKHILNETGRLTIELDKCNQLTILLPQAIPCITDLERKLVVVLDSVYADEVSGSCREIIAASSLDDSVLEWAETLIENVKSQLRYVPKAGAGAEANFDICSKDKVARGISPLTF